MLADMIRAEVYIQNSPDALLDYGIKNEISRINELMAIPSNAFESPEKARPWM